MQKTKNFIVKGLKTISVERMEKGFQVTGENQMVGLEGRSELLKRLGGVLENEQTYFPSQQGLTSRPGNIVGKVIV
jgi:hypothetical protein